jgi:mitochondrial import receptor subunit TOM40
MSYEHHAETHLTNFLFDGARADLTKGLSLSPAFQVTHSFSLASATQPPSYNFGAVFADNNTLLQGGVDHTGSVTARANQSWGANDTTKMQAQVSRNCQAGEMWRMTC